MIGATIVVQVCERREIDPKLYVDGMGEAQKSL